VSGRGMTPPSIPPGSAVIVNLASPSEKYWGILGEIGVAGVTMRGIGVQSFDDWTAQAARGEERTLDLATMFFPLFRIERIFLDEPVGEVESYRQRFEKRVGRRVEEYLGMVDAGELADEDGVSN
jgi:hypothetical protein